MRISELKNCPEWLRDAITVDADVDIVNGYVIWRGGDFLGGNFRGGNFLGGDFLGGDFLGGNFLGGNFLGGDFCGGDFCGGNFRGGDFRGGDFCGGNFRGGDFLGGNFLGGLTSGSNLKVVALRSGHLGLYPYQVMSILFEDGSRWVRMGCLFKSLKDWKKIGIRNSNLAEFPDDGSERCLERVAAFNFARAAALRLKPTGGK